MGLGALSSQRVATSQDHHFNRQAFTLAEAPAAEEPKTAEQCSQNLDDISTALNRYDYIYRDVNSKINHFSSQINALQNGSTQQTRYALTRQELERIMVQGQDSDSALQGIKDKYALFRQECSDHIPALQEDPDKKAKLDGLDKRLGSSSPSAFSSVPAPPIIIPAAAGASAGAGAGAGLSLGEIWGALWGTFRAITSPTP